MRSVIDVIYWKNNFLLHAVQDQSNKYIINY
jgi:hypothetical protein